METLHSKNPGKIILYIVYYIMVKRPKKFKVKAKNGKGKIAKPTPRYAMNVNLHSLNRSPMAMQKKMSFNYEFTFALVTDVGQFNATQLFDLQSPWDPDYTNLTRNASVSYWNTFMGATAGKYEKFLVDHATLEIEAFCFTSGELATIVYSLTTKRELEYQPTVDINTIGQRPMATALTVNKSGGKGIKKKLVCTPYKVHGIRKKDYTQKITTPSVAGVTGADTGYFCEHNLRSRNSSWLAVSVGGRTDRSSGFPQAIECRFQGRITYHGTAYRPILG